MATSHPTSYIPGTIPTLGNWPEGLRMPPRRHPEKQVEKKQPEKKTEPSESSLWDFSDYVE